MYVYKLQQRGWGQTKTSSSKSSSYYNMTRILFYKHKHEFNYKILCVRESQHCRDSDYSFGCCFLNARARTILVANRAPLLHTMRSERWKSTRATIIMYALACWIWLKFLYILFASENFFFPFALCPVRCIKCATESWVCWVKALRVSKKKKLFLEHEHWTMNILQWALTLHTADWCNEWFQVLHSWNYLSQPCHRLYRLIYQTF